MAWGTIVKSVVIYRVMPNEAQGKQDDAIDYATKLREQLCILAQPGEEASQRFSDLLDELAEASIDTYRIGLIVNAQPDEIEEY